MTNLPIGAVIKLVKVRIIRSDGTIEEIEVNNDG